MTRGGSCRGGWLFRDGLSHAARDRSCRGRVGHLGVGQIM